jgi:uncharacterized membrane protein YebE (DUF533 family)
VLELPQTIVRIISDGLPFVRYASAFAVERTFSAYPTEGMVNIDRILGSLVSSIASGTLSQVMHRGKARRYGMDLGRKVERMQNKKALGMGALGLAIAAWEHFQEQHGVQPTPTGAPVSRPSGPPPPPPPAPQQRSTIADVPEALILLRAMISAANADGAIDADERIAIVDSLRGEGLSAEDSAFLEQELNQPWPVAAIIASATGAEVAEQIYSVSLLTITLDTDEEKKHLDSLARGLKLSEEQLARARSLMRGE